MSKRLPPKLEAALLDSEIVTSVFDRWAEVALPNCWMVAGAVFQTYWNHAHGYAPRHGISDIDLIYFDPDDLSEGAENDHSIRINSYHKDLDLRLDVKNEARVHLWYEERFGYPIEAYTSAEAAIETFPTTAGAIAVRPSEQRLEAFAPFGFDDLMACVIRANKRQITKKIYSDKVERWRPNWPQVEYLSWEDS